MTVEEVYKQNERLSTMPYNVLKTAVYNVNGHQEIDREELFKKKVLARQSLVPAHIRKHLKSATQLRQSLEVPEYLENEEENLS